MGAGRGGGRILSLTSSGACKILSTSSVQEEEDMFKKQSAVLAAIAGAVALVLQAAPGSLRAQTEPPALSGRVSSAEEGAMEGVLVSAKKAGSTITITVVSDAQGRYRFPTGKLEPGSYALRIRAVGYDLDGPGAADVAANKTATLDLKLKKTSDLAAQLSNGEWMASVPGTDQQKGQLLNCVGCHTLERVARSQYDADSFTKTILPRMQGYVNQSIPQHPQLRKAERLMEERGDQRVQVYRTTAEYLATINRGAAQKWGYELKTHPRPSGRATRRPARSRNSRSTCTSRDSRRGSSACARTKKGICGSATCIRRPSSSSTAGRRNSPPGSCPPSRTSTRRRSTW